MNTADAMDHLALFCLHYPHVSIIYAYPKSGNVRRILHTQQSVKKNKTQIYLKISKEPTTYLLSTFCFPLEINLHGIFYLQLQEDIVSHLHSGICSINIHCMFCHTKGKHFTIAFLVHFSFKGNIIILYGSY